MNIYDSIKSLFQTQQIDLDLPPFLFDPNLDKAVVAKYLEHEINEQAKTLEDLQKLVRFQIF